MKKRESFTRAARICGTNPTSFQLEAAGWARLTGRHGEDFMYGIRRTSGWGARSPRDGDIIKGHECRVDRRGINHFLGGVQRRDFPVSFTRDEGFKVSLT